LSLFLGQGLSGLSMLTANSPDSSDAPTSAS
jgi:hypothetical protein